MKKLLLEDASKCNEYQTEVFEPQSARDRDVAVIEKASSTSASPTTEELFKLYTQELKTMHAQVTALHEASLKVAADAATIAAKAETAAAAPDKSMQASLKAAANAATAVTKVEAAAASNKSVQAASTETYLNSRS